MLIIQAAMNILETEKVKMLYGKLEEMKMTLGVAESCTGGMLAQVLTSVPGSSRFFKGGIVAYSNEVKHKILNVPMEVLQKNGAVSKECVELMVENVKSLLETDIGCAITGIAGPGGATKDKPVGSVYIAVSSPAIRIVRSQRFSGNREEIRMISVITALDMLLLLIDKTLKD